MTEKIGSYLVIQKKHKPHAILQVNPNELSVLIGHNEEPELHGIVGIRASESKNIISECDIIVISRVPECLRQIGNAFITAADNLDEIVADTVGDMIGIINDDTEMEEADNE